MDTSDLLDSLAFLKEDPGSISDILPSCTLNGLITWRKTKYIGQIMHDLGDSKDSLLTELLDYSSTVLPPDQQLRADEDKLCRLLAERFTKLEIQVLKFPQANAFTPRILQYIMKGNFRNYERRNDWI